MLSVGAKVGWVVNAVVRLVGSHAVLVCGTIVEGARERDAEEDLVGLIAVPDGLVVEVGRLSMEEKRKVVRHCV